MEQKIINAKDFSEILYMINKPYRLLYLCANSLILDVETFTKYLKDVWIQTEFPNADKDVSTKELIKLFERADKKLLMDDEELNFYNQLPNVVTIYRGTYRSANSKALSWTTDYDIAHWFATRFDDEGYILQAKINKKDIFAFFNNRNEKEVVINYNKIKYLSFEKVMKIDI